MLSIQMMRNSVYFGDKKAIQLKGNQDSIEHRHKIDFRVYVRFSH